MTDPRRSFAHLYETAQKADRLSEVRALLLVLDVPEAIRRELSILRSRYRELQTTGRTDKVLTESMLWLIECADHGTEDDLPFYRLVLNANNPLYAMFFLQTFRSAWRDPDATPGVRGLIALLDHLTPIHVQREARQVKANLLNFAMRYRHHPMARALLPYTRFNQQ